MKWNSSRWAHHLTARLSSRVRTDQMSANVWHPGLHAVRSISPWKGAKNSDRYPYDLGHRRCIPDTNRYKSCRDIRSAPNYKNLSPLVITLRISRDPSRTIGERIRRWRLEKGLFQKDLARLMGVDEMTFVNLAKGETRPLPSKPDKINGFLRD